MKRIGWILATLAAGGVSPAFGESFNIDYGANVLSKPGNLYGAVPPQAGFWNAVPNPAVFPLRDLGNIATPVTIAGTGGMAFACNDPNTAGGDQRLLDDTLRFNPGPATFTIANILCGTYWVYTYAWGPCNPAHLTDVTVFDSAGVSCGTDQCGGVWPGAIGALDAAGQTVTYVCHQVVVSSPAGAARANFTIRFAVAGFAGTFAHLAGIQITPPGIGPGPTALPNDDNPDMVMAPDPQIGHAAIEVSAVDVNADGQSDELGSAIVIAAIGSCNDDERFDLSADLGSSGCVDFASLKRVLEKLEVKLL